MVAAMQSINGLTDVLLVVADPVAQVKAPQVFNHVFARAGVNAVVVPARAGADRLAGFVREMLAVPNIRGLLVSIPHKTTVLDALDRVDAAAAAAGAVNAVRRGADGALEGAMFDGAGFVAALAHHRVPLQGQRVLLVGAGGAGLAIAAALAGCPLAQLVVHDTAAGRAAALAARLAEAASFDVRVAASSDPAGFDIVVNATPLGLQADDPLPLDVQRLARHAVVADILMTGAPTPLLRACHGRGIAAWPGHEMLVQQVPAYLDFFGFSTLGARLGNGGDPWLGEVRTLLSH